MVHIILSQSHDDFSRLVLCVIFTGILTWIFGYASLSLIEYYCNNHRCHFITDILKDLALSNYRNDRISRSVLLVDL